MGDYKGSKFGGKRSGGFKSHGYGGGRDDSRPAMHQAVCSDCGNNCEVPFRPTGDKPVYCSDCFRNKDQNDGPRNFRDTGNRRDGGDRDFRNDKPRPRYEDKRPYSAPSVNTGNNENIGRHLEQINVTLNKILHALVPVVTERSKEVEALKSKEQKIAQKKIVDTNAINNLVADAIDSKKKKKTSPKKKK